MGAAETREFGAPIAIDASTELAEVISEPTRYSDRAIRLEGRLVDLCTKKGCWTVLADGEHSVRVRFADYGFFLPQDAIGKRATMEGRAEVRTVSQREARHLASESRGGDPSSIEGPQTQLEFVATGVRIHATGGAKEGQ